MRSGPDIRLTVTFLCRRVREPTTHDWMKLVRMMNFLSQVPWTKHFLEEQDYPIEAHIILQDNESAIKLETDNRSIPGTTRDSHD